MTDLEVKVGELNRLILDGKTLKAMDLFYAENVTMQENEEAPKVGKQNCLNNEFQNLNNTKEVKCKLLN